MRGGTRSAWRALGSGGAAFAAGLCDAAGAPCAALVGAFGGAFGGALGDAFVDAFVDESGDAGGEAGGAAVGLEGKAGGCDEFNSRADDRSSPWRHRRHQHSHQHWHQHWHQRRRAEIRC